MIDWLILIIIIQAVRRQEKRDRIQPREQRAERRENIAGTRGRDRSKHRESRFAGRCRGASSTPGRPASVDKNRRQHHRQQPETP